MEQNVNFPANKHKHIVVQITEHITESQQSGTSTNLFNIAFCS